MKTWGSGGIALPFLTSLLDGGEWLASRLGCYAPGKISASTDSIGGWSCPRAGLDTVETRKILFCWQLNLGHPAYSLLLYHLS
jgi:hypothetical protein